MDKDYLNYVLACWFFNVILGSCSIAGENTSNTMKNQFDQYPIMCVFCFNIYCYTTKIMFVTFVLIFKFILIYLLHVLFILKIEGIFENEKVSPKVLKGIVYFIYNIDFFLTKTKRHSFIQIDRVYNSIPLNYS